MNEKKKEKGKKNEKQKGADLPSWIVASGPKLQVVFAQPHQFALVIESADFGRIARNFTHVLRPEFPASRRNEEEEEKEEAAAKKEKPKEA